MSVPFRPASLRLPMHSEPPRRDAAVPMVCCCWCWRARRSGSCASASTSYLALEIRIWMLYALGTTCCWLTPGCPRSARRLLRHRRLRVRAAAASRRGRTLVRPRRRGAGRRDRRRPGGRLHLAPPRHIYALLTIAFGQVVWFVAIKWHTVTGARTASSTSAAAGDSASPRSTSSRTRRSTTSRSRSSRSGLRALAARAFRRSAGFLTAIKQNETRAAFVGYNVWLYKWIASRCRRQSRHRRGRSSRWRRQSRIRTDEPARVGLRRGG